jgi:predicted RNA-binding Zn-ribbon protein involved in translation (DUF1610 family)
MPLVTGRIDDPTIGLTDYPTIGLPTTRPPSKMTAVLDVVDCPQCGWSAFYEYQTRTLSTTIFCPRCGYQEETRPNKKRKPALSGVEGTKADPSFIVRAND